MPEPQVNSNKTKSDTTQEKKLKPCCACPETKRIRDACIMENGEENCGKLIEAHKQCMRDAGFNMVNIAERGQTLHKDINQLYSKSRQKIDEALGLNANGIIEHAAQVKEIQTILREMQAKINSLRELAARADKNEVQTEILVNVGAHEKQLAKLQRELRDSSIEVRKEIAAEERKALLQGMSTGKKSINLESTGPRQRSTRMSELVTRMAERVTQSENTMGNLVHSSSVLSQTQTEYENQAGHIRTSSKLLSKYERRELTDKILLIIALIFYFAVVYYILQKRVLTWFWIF
ncbi:unnamed protein product [Caenorhabditis auriculariae]|uniref:Cytochrome c oxidase copper chaperone n=1 Tax=Caenorhabditis auriculariae TaxID=2777116 RepID=A0A8S1HLY5_9PELO|nr:unnamed protein product [Caenorhabditis auriculariae]